MPSASADGPSASRRWKAASSTSSPSTSAAGLATTTRPRSPATRRPSWPALQAVLATKGGGITVLNYTPAQDQNAFVVRKETADQFKLTKMSDLTAVAAQLKFGVATGLRHEPGLRRGPQDRLRPRPDEGDPARGLRHADGPGAGRQDDRRRRALLDPARHRREQPGVVLTDDKQTQPADNIAPLVRNDYLAKVDKAAFSKILNDVSAKMDTATLTDLGKQIAVDKKDIAVVAKAWLQANGFVK